MKTQQEISAGGVVYKKEKNKPTLWLITQHSQNKSWGFPKGLIGDDKTESIEEAALREVHEEGGVVARIILPQPVSIHYQYHWKGSPHGGTTKQNMLVDKTVHYFLMEYCSGDPKNHDYEMMDARFVTEEELLNTLTHASEKEVFKKLSILIQ